ncbi:hypothetical protein BKA93DRAFT_813808 [Sparassis latifolia]
MQLAGCSFRTLPQLAIFLTSFTRLNSVRLVDVSLKTPAYVFVDSTISIENPGDLNLMLSAELDRKFGRQSVGH